MESVTFDQIEIAASLVAFAELKTVTLIFNLSLNHWIRNVILIY
jgi:hypothetical protein